MSAHVASEDAFGSEDAMQWVLEAYRAMLPVKSVIVSIKQRFCSDDAHWSSLEMQAKIMHAVVFDPICDKFSPHKTYVYRFLKSYMSEIEAHGAEAHDDLVSELMEYVVYGQLGKNSLSAEDMHHVSFTIPTSFAPEEIAATLPSSPLVVTCRVASVFNDVGLKLWEAGWFLAEYIITHPAVFTDKVVLELGAGVGFTGLVLAEITKPKRVLLSDYAPNVMQNLRYNVEVNASRFQCPVDVLTLDWDTWEPSVEDEELRPDILLAGDCVYDVASFPSLVRVLQAFLGPTTTATAAEHSARERKAIFASTIRNQTTFQAFLDQLAVFEITYTDITTSALEQMGVKQMFAYENRGQIRLCELTRATKCEAP
ncbi:putative methyltransferase, partial [Globisporangium splendens]